MSAALKPRRRDRRYIAQQIDPEVLKQCADTLQHWPLDRVEKAMASVAAELLIPMPHLLSALQMIQLATPAGMDAIAAMILRDNGQNLSRPNARKLRRFVTLAKMAEALTRRAAPRARRAEEMPRPRTVHERQEHMDL